MSNISFKGIYYIPNNNIENPNFENAPDFMNIIDDIKDPKKSKYDGENGLYCIYVRNGKDNKFVDLASMSGIIYYTPASKNLAFLNAAINNGAKYDKKINEKDNSQEITLYNCDSKDIFAVYNILCGKLVKKIEYLNGKPECVHEFDSKGQYIHSKLIGENNLEFNYNQGTPSVVLPSEN